MAVTHIILKKGRDKSIRAKHPWIFSGAIQAIKGQPAPGETVEVYAENGDILGLGAWSPKSQIQVRMWKIGKGEINRDFFKQRIESALQQRAAIGITRLNTAYRIINAESDGIPGMVIDQIGDWVIMQCLSTGAEFWKHDIADILMELTNCRGVYERSDVAIRQKEGLKETKGVLKGEEPPAHIDIVEEGRHYRVDVCNGHKTGFYLDQRDNRSLVGHYAKDKTILNCFSYTGGFAIAAGLAKAKHVTSIDASSHALEHAQQAYELNKLDSKQTKNICGDVFKLLREYDHAGKQFDMIILDPPKFAENRNQIKKAARGYKDINRLGFKLLKPGGLLFTFSCSGLIDAHLFQKIVSDAALDAGCDGQIIHKLSQASDHPIRLAFPEGFYLKGLVCQKITL